MLLLSLLLACKSQYPDLDAGLYADIQTDKGAILVKLAHEEAPITVANFVSLSEGTNPIVSEEFKSRKFYNFKRGTLKKIKRGYNKRFRKFSK